MGSLNLLTTTAPLGDANEVHKTNKIDKIRRKTALALMRKILGC